MARASAKSQRHVGAHDEKRDEIIRHCAGLFDKVGYHKTSMQMLADEVGLGKPTIYHYFPSKHAILYAIHDEYMTALLDGLTNRDQLADPFDLLKGACGNILKQISEHPGYVRAFMDHYGDLEGKMREAIRERRAEYFEAIRSIIIRGVQTGRFRKCDPLFATYAFLGMCNWAYKWYPPLAKERSPEEAADALCLPFFQGLAASAG